MTSRRLRDDEDLTESGTVELKGHASGRAGRKTNVDLPGDVILRALEVNLWRVGVRRRVARVQHRFPMLLDHEAVLVAVLAGSRPGRERADEHDGPACDQVAPPAEDEAGQAAPAEEPLEAVRPPGGVAVGCDRRAE